MSNIKSTVAVKKIETTFTVVSADLSKVVALFDKVNKNGMFAITKKESFKKNVVISRFNIVEYTFVNITIEGEVNGIPGFDIVGRLEDDESGSRIITEFSEGKNLSQFRNTPLFCNHCETNHRRVSSWVFENQETHAYTQVGNSCIEKYTGMSVNAADIIKRIFQISDAFGVTDFEQKENDGFGTPALSISDVLAIAAAVCMKDGKFFGARYEENSTKIAVQVLMFGNKITDYLGHESLDALIDANKHYVQDIIDAVNAIEYDENHKMANWYANLQSILENGADGYVGMKRFGLLVSAAYFMPAIQPKAKKESNNTWYGNVGDKKVAISGEIVNIGTWYPSGYGGSFRYVTIIDSAGYAFKFAQNDDKFGDSIVIGNLVSFTATIAKHDEYQGNKYTTLKMVKLPK